MAGADDFDVEDMLEEAYNKKPRSEENGSEGESKRDEKKRHRKHHRRSRSRSRSRSPHKRHRRRSGSRERRRSGSRERKRHRSRSRSPRRRSRSPRRRSRSPRRDRRSRGHSRERRRSPTPPRRDSVGQGGPPAAPPMYKRSPTPPRKAPVSQGGPPGAPPMYKRVGGRSPEPELPSEDRDRRTVMCMQLAAKVGPKHLEEFFQKVGQVREVKMIADKNSRRSKGIAYVEFHDESSVIEAMKLTGQRLYGVPIIVQPTMAEKNRLAAQAQNLMKQEGPRKVYVGCLHSDITEDMLKRIFEPFGSVENLMIQRDEAKQSKGFGFIEFKDSDAAERAVNSMNGFDILGRAIKVTLVTENPLGGMAIAMGGGAAMETLDSDEYLGGVGLTLQTRASLMAKLAENHNVGISAPKIVGLPVSSTCFMLSNMFDPTAETEPGWDADIRDDVLEECSVHGPVLHIHVDTYSQGNVYVKCATPQIASAAFNALNGRMFSGKRIVAQFIPDDTYNSKFPAALSASQPLRPLSEPA